MSGMMSSLASSVIQNNLAAEMYAMIRPSLSPSLDTGFAGDICVFTIPGLHGPCFVPTESSGEAEADEEGATER